jgi:laminin, alpha 1/2
MLKNVSEIEFERSIKWEADEDDLAKRSYYSIQSIIAYGRCNCNGHAGKCREQIDEKDKSASKLPQCECMHNTCGKNCERCCPLYNQKPFRIGTPQKENRCEKCQCHGHADECRYSQDIDKRNLSLNIKGKMIGGGVCVNCTKFTTGINCEKCLPGYYRPYDRALDDDVPCVPCDCSGKGSVGACNPIGGECVCKQGFSGAKCDSCAVGYNGNNCEKCSCDIRGTMPGGECEDQCQCKMFVEGEKCDKCVEGFFGLSKENHEGCLKCFCSGIGVNCESHKVERKLFETLDGWSVVDILKTQTAYPTRDNETGFMVFGMYELADIEAVYWSAPQIYLGNRLEHYGSHFLYQMDWVIVRGDTSGKPTSGPNFILMGKNGMKIAHGDGTFKNSNASVDILMSEEGWYHVPKTVKDIKTRLRRTEYRGDPVTRTQFMSVLSNIDSILIRGTYHTDQAEGILKRATFYAGDISSSNDILDVHEEKSFVEKCFCPPGYDGLSCEECTFGHIKIFDNSSTHEKIIKCLPCDCNGHSTSCDVVESQCGECVHNTIGER